MTALMTKVMERLGRVPEDRQEGVARRILDMPELKQDGSSQGTAPKLSELIGRGKGLYQNPGEVDQYLRDLRDEE